MTHPATPRPTTPPTPTADDTARAALATGLVRRLLELARDEDLGPNGLDLTTAALPAGPAEERAFTIRARQPATLAGLAFLPELCTVFGDAVTARPLASEGGRAHAGDPVATLTGPADAVVALERTALNLLGRLSGVATLTAAFVARARDARPEATPAVLDTRKTTPGLRVLEKHAVRCGGGTPHRMGLYDAVLIKDNHVAGLDPAAFADAVRTAAASARARPPEADAFGPIPRFVTAEVDTLDQLDALLALGPSDRPDIVLLDNMPPAALERAVARRDHAGAAVLLEASGGVTLDTIGPIAAAGVDRISVGSLTRAAKTLDLGLDAD